MYGKATLRELRNIISDIFVESSDLKTKSEQHHQILVHQNDVFALLTRTLQYENTYWIAHACQGKFILKKKRSATTQTSTFCRYSSMDHARNVGTMFRDPANALLPNWKHLQEFCTSSLPRTSFINQTKWWVISYMLNVQLNCRPKGQLCPDETKPPDTSDHDYFGLTILPWIVCMSVLCVWTFQDDWLRIGNGFYHLWRYLWV